MLRGIWSVLSRFGYPRSGCFFLFLLFFAGSGALALFGLDLATQEAWLDAHGGMFETVGSWLFRLFCGFVFLMSLLVVGVGLWDFVERLRNRKTSSEPLGCCGVVVAAGIAWFSWFGIFG